MILRLELHQREDRASPDVTGGRERAPLFSSTLAHVPPARSERPWLASTVMHLAVLVPLIGWASRDVAAPTPTSLVQHRPPLVFLPSTRTPRPVQPAAASRPRSRISIGSKSDQRLRELIVTRDSDLTQVARGTTKDDVLRARAVEETHDVRADREPSAPEALPPSSLGSRPPAAGAPAAPTRLDVAGAVARAVATSGTWGEPNGTTESIGPLRFDPHGADFTRWIQHFKTEVYRNWMVPQSVAWGWGGRVGFIFELDRQGQLVSLLAEGTTGTSALDRAARNALQASSLLPLPSDYGPSTVTMKVTFDYGPDRRSASRR